MTADAFGPAVSGTRLPVNPMVNWREGNSLALQGVCMVHGADAVSRGFLVFASGEPGAPLATGYGKFG